MSEQEAVLQAVFCDLRPIKSRKVVQFVFEVQTEAADHAIKVLGGFPRPDESRWFAIARIDPKYTEAKPAEKKTESWAEMALSKRAGILCKDRQFQQWLQDQSSGGEAMMWMTADGAARREELAVSFIYRACGIGSRMLLDNSDNPAKVFHALESEYLAAVGRLPAPR